MAEVLCVYRKVKLLSSFNIQHAQGATCATDLPHEAEPASSAKALPLAAIGKLPFVLPHLPLAHLRSPLQRGRHSRALIRAAYTRGIRQVGRTHSL